MGIGCRTRFRDRGCAGLQQLLSPRLLLLEDREPGVAQALLIFGGARLGGGDIRVGLFDRALGARPPLIQDFNQGLCTITV